MSQARQITAVLDAISQGDHVATDRLFPLVYEELRGIASDYMRKQPAGHTLRSTALVNEAYIKLCGAERPDWKSRTHFFAAGAQAMRRILVDHA
ncbi:MAG: RNA polymerase subunit sigma-70, partial [Myxococcales bacterium]|nr:RNA polymerase subunit sigma-70 [Myxococcales bacterium]